MMASYAQCSSTKLNVSPMTSKQSTGVFLTTVSNTIPKIRTTTNTNSDGGDKTSSKLPLTSTKPKPFRRTASLRLRSSKSSLNNDYQTEQFDNGTEFSTPIETLRKFSADVTNNISTGSSNSSKRNLNQSCSELSKTDHHIDKSAKEPQFEESCANTTTESIINNYHSDSSKSKKDMTQINGVVECLNGDENESIGKQRNTNGMSLNLNGPTKTTNCNGQISPIVKNCIGTPPTGKTPKTPNTPHTPRIPLYTVPESKAVPKTPPVTPDSPGTYFDDDLDSLYSYTSTTSGLSTMSCEHPYVARNGTTFSGRKMKYVVHCSSYAGQVGNDYLTPTQRAQRQIRRLKELLMAARHDLEQKDTELLRLTREVVELRLFKASLSSPEDRSNSSDAVTVREAELKTSQDVSPIVDMADDPIKSSPRHILHSHHGIVHHTQLLANSEMQSSFADSGHFEDMTTSSVHSKDSFLHTHDQACGSDESAATYEEQRQELIQMYEQRIEELIKTQDTATNDIKQSHNDRVEGLLQKLAECNTRYADIVPDYEQAKERIRELEKQLEDLQRKLQEQEDKQNKMYLHMYQKGQEAERISRADQALELAHREPNKVSLPELLQQLQSTQDELENIRAAECRSKCGGNQSLLTAKEAISLWVLGARKTIYRKLLDAQKTRSHVDPEITLQFLKSAVYYFLTDKENSQGHLQAIESILEFTEKEKININKARQTK